MEREANDFWSPSLIIVFAVCALAAVLGIVLLIEASPIILMLVIGCILLTLPWIIGWLCFDLIRKRFRHALSLLAAVAMAVSIIYCTPLIAQGKDTLAFYARLAQFEKQVENARSQQSTPKPLQIVVYYQDRSIFVTANSFYFVIYDETDGIEFNGDHDWPYDKSSTGVKWVNIPSKMHHLTGHYYDFSTSY
jgi:hypothetical protein